MSEKDKRSANSKQLNCGCKSLCQGGGVGGEGVNVADSDI